MTPVAAVALLAKNIAVRTVINERHRTVRLAIVCVLVCADILYPNWITAAVALAAVIYMAVRNRIDGMATSAALTVLDLASKAIEEEKSPND